ncbi:uncharacterized protein TM35_000721070 [Trypanosoma theileri]|uniref:Uncharacterized protein n=1 Tax=Trypanosoma theileri TaxID=67003 RepID=A0A1X0NF90_9TRYP|nr:uncharacterized protein TM35_000721070 [Trypanosoma theileri]ORC83404.1 hypothetical protein TM35_000721070 [Trypanosoma theileri]
MQSQSSPTNNGDSSRRSFDSRLPPVVLEKQIKVSNYSHSTASAMAGQLEQCVGLLRGHSIALQHCNEEIEGALLTLGVDATHSLLYSINNVIEGLEVVAGACKNMCESHFEEVRQREDLFNSLSSMYISLKERHEATERELRSIVAERDRKVAAFEKAVSYVESVIAERALWQEQNGYNCTGLPLVERSFADRCRETLEVFDTIIHETSNQNGENTEHLLSSTDAPETLVKRWERNENLLHVNGTPSARLQYVPPGDEVILLREVLEMGTGSRVLLRDVREERKALEEAKRKVCEIGVTSLATLQTVRSELLSFREWIVGLEQRGQPFNASFENFRSMVTDLEKKITQESLTQSVLAGVA